MLTMSAIKSVQTSSNSQTARLDCGSRTVHWFKNNESRSIQVQLQGKLRQSENIFSI